ncbi:MAG: epoxyqueuosine reductase [Desulfobacteraceae bacterium]|nr:epoxyqueuosine reductase [Desulfobacteraceae bacterium]
MKSSNRVEDPGAWIESTIKSFINNSPENSLKNEGNDRAWMDPLVGFSRGDDHLYREFKEYVGSFHWTPVEIFTRTFPAVKVGPGELTVISWVLPQNERTKSDNRKQTTYPSERWVRARVHGEEANEKLRSHVVEILQESGYEAVAPMLSPFFERQTSERYGFASTWSERHAAYASGLGTFGLCDGLITSRGKAMRCGSVVVHIRIPPTNRPYSDHHAYCLFFTKGLCGECIHRCPVKAITEAGHDKAQCNNYLRPMVADYVRSHFGLEGKAYGCGLCQTDVPCESKIPTESDVT